MKEPKKKEPFTAGQLIKYLQQFDEDRQLNIGVVAHKNNARFMYPIEGTTLITDLPDPCIILKIGKAVKVEKPSERIQKGANNGGKVKK